MLAIANPADWMMVLAPTVLSIVVAALYAGHREFQALRDRVGTVEFKVDLVLQRMEEWHNGSGPTS